MDLFRLKIELMHHGVRLTERAVQALPKGRFNQLVHRDYPTTGGLVIEITPEYYANSAIDYRNTSPFTLDFDGGNYFLNGEGEPRAVAILPPPRFALDNTMLENGQPARNFVMAHADRARISPIYGCSFHCEFCNAPLVPYNKTPLAQLGEAFEIALQDDLLKPRHVLISGGTPERTEADYRYLDEVYQYFPEKYSTLEFDVMLSPRPKQPGPHTPRKYANYIKYLDECHISGLSVNLELFGEAIRRKVIPEKEEIGRDNYFLFLEKAVERFGSERVRSCLVVGLESREDTLSGVEEIAKRGAMPVLSPFVPAPGAFLAREQAPSPDYLIDVLLASKGILERYGLELGPKCRPCCHNNLIL